MFKGKTDIYRTAGLTADDAANAIAAQLRYQHLRTVEALARSLWLGYRVKFIRDAWNPPPKFGLRATWPRAKAP